MDLASASTSVETDLLLNNYSKKPADNLRQLTSPRRTKIKTNSLTSSEKLKEKCSFNNKTSEPSPSRSTDQTRRALAKLLETKKRKSMQKRSEGQQFN